MTIKETAGKILLYFYQLQRTVPSNVRYRQIGFIEQQNGGVSILTDKKWLTKNLVDINPSALDIFNAFSFLTDKGFIQTRARFTKGTTIYVGLQLTDKGIDIVEGVEGGPEGRAAFTTAFNIQVADDVVVEVLIKDALGALLGS